MTLLEQYNAALDQRAAQERESAASAKKQGDEREQSMHLMQASMLGDMLKVLGRVQHTRQKPHIMNEQIAMFYVESEKEKARGDYDLADRSVSKAQTIEWALATLTELEAQHNG